MFRLLSRSRNTQEKVKPIEINARHSVYSVAFLADGKHILTGGGEGKIRRWRVDDGKEDGVPMDAGNLICSIAVSRDSKWIVSGTESGAVIVWETETYKKTMNLRAHTGRWVRAVDVSPSGTRIATGSDDQTVCVWSHSTGELLDTWKHDYELSAVKFSPDGLLIATATWGRKSIRVYDCRNRNLPVDFAISVASWLNETLAWSSNKNLVAISNDSKINYLDVSAGTTLVLERPIHGSGNLNCIALATNGLFIAASDNSSVSFSDAASHEQIQVGPVVNHAYTIESMAISAKFDLAIAGYNKITLCSLRNILPSCYFDTISEPTKESLQAQEKRSSSPRALLNLIHASDATLELWQKDRLLEAIGVVSEEKRKHNNQHHDMLATRAFLRARLRQWGPAIMDAQRSITIQPNVLAYIALGMARFGRRNVKSAKEAFHRLVYKCNVTEMLPFVFLIKAVVMFNFGYREEAMVCVAVLISGCHLEQKVAFRAIQTYMRLIEAKACVGRQAYDKALELLELVADLQDSPQFPNDPQVECISLMFGWMVDSDTMKFMFYQQRCEALCGLERQNEASMLLDVAWMDLERQSVSRKEVKEWLRDFTRRFIQELPDVRTM